MLLLEDKGPQEIAFDTRQWLSYTSPCGMLTQTVPDEHTAGAEGALGVPREEDEQGPVSANAEDAHPAVFAICIDIRTAYPPP